MQLVKAELPAGEFAFSGHVRHEEGLEAAIAEEYLPPPQSTHGADPEDTLYFPATHGMHLYPSGPDWPAMHVQFVKVVLPAGEMEFSGHATHLELVRLRLLRSMSLLHNRCTELTPPLICTSLPRTAHTQLVGRSNLVYMHTTALARCKFPVHLVVVW